MSKSNCSKKTMKSSSKDVKSKMNIQVEKNKIIDYVNTENNTVENRAIHTPFSNTSEKEHRKMVSFASVKKVLDMFTKSFVQYGQHLYSNYIEKNVGDKYEGLMKKSYLRNVRFVINPTWADYNNEDEYPDYRTPDGIHSLFYMISEENKNTWIFEHVETFEKEDELSDELIMEAFNALLDGVYHEEFMANNDRVYSYFTFYLNVLKCTLNKKGNNYTQTIYHIGSLLQINDGISSLYQEYTNLEGCVATKNLIMAIHSLTIMNRNNISKALAFTGIDIKTYVKCILTPFFGVFYALQYLDMEDYINEIDSNVYNQMCVSKPHESWIDEDSDSDEEEYRREIEKSIKLQRAKRALEEESRQRVINSTPVYDLPRGPAPILNKKFAQKLEKEKASAASAASESTSEFNTTASVNSRASAFITETAKVKSSPVSSVSSQHTNPLTYVAHDFVFEHDKVPRSIRRNDKKDVNGRDEGFLLFFSGSDNDTVYERCAFSTPSGKCSIRDACRELPRLLVEKERLLRSSRNMVFGRTLEDLFQTDVNKRSLYYTNLRRGIISFCNEIAATTKFDNAGRMEIIQKYYGIRREGETERMYINSFMFDVFRTFVNFYTYAKDK